MYKLIKDVWYLMNGIKNRHEVITIDAYSAFADAYADLFGYYELICGDFVKCLSNDACIALRYTNGKVDMSITYRIERVQ